MKMVKKTNKKVVKKEAVVNDKKALLKEMNKIANNKKAKTVNYNHSDVFKIGQDFAKTINADTGVQHINRAQPYDALTIVKYKKTIAWFLPDANKETRFRVYLFAPDGKEIIKVKTDEEQEQCFERITTVYNETKEVVKVKVSKAKTPVKAKWEKVEEHLDSFDKKMAIPAGYKADDEQLQEAIKARNLEIVEGIIVRP